MKWEVKKITEGTDKGKWGIFLLPKYCKTKKAVCYGASINKKAASFLVKRMNNPDYWTD